MVIDKKKVKMVLSVVALSMSLGFNAKYMGSEITPAPVIEETQSTKKHSLRVIKNGVVKESSVAKVMQLFQKHLSSGAYQHFCDNGEVQLLGDTDVKDYVLGHYGAGHAMLREGDRLPVESGIKFILVEGCIDDMVPQVSSIIQQYYDNTVVGA